MMEICTAMAFCVWDSHQEGTWHLLRLQKHCTQNTWYAWRTAWSPLEDKRRGRLAAGSPLRPHLGESSWTGLFFLGNFSPPLLFFPSMFVVGGPFLFKYLVLPNLVINLMHQKDVLDTLFRVFPAGSRLYILQFEKCVVM